MSDYLTGVEITVNGTPATIASATRREADHDIVDYVLDTPVSAGDDVKFSYSGGHIVAESGGAKLADVSAQTVTNNVSGGDPGATLRADAVAYYTLDEQSGTRLDSTSHHIDLTPAHDVGGADPTFILGVAGNAARFNDDFGILWHDDNAMLHIPESGGFSITAWMRWRNLSPHDNPYGAGIAMDGLTTYEYAIETTSSDEGATFGIDLETNASPWDIIGYPANGSLQTGVWYFIEGNFDIDHHSATLRINNVIAATTNELAAIEYIPARFSIGGRYQPDNIFVLTCDADIDEVLIIRRLLTDAERSYLYNDGAGRALFPAP